MNILSFKIVTASTAHTLRAISVITFPPAFIMLFIQGVLSERVNPAIGILPMFFSSAYSLLVLANERKCGCSASGLTGTPLHMLFDILCGIGVLTCLILTWIFLPRSCSWGYSCRDAGLVMLGTYGTNFLLANFLIHLYFVIRQIVDAVRPGSSSPSSCPQCQYGSFPSITVQFHKGPRAGYAPLLDSDGLPTTSEEERREDGGEMA